MRVRRVAAEQAHAVPSRAYDASAIFDSSILSSARPVQERGDLDDGGGYTPPGSTAQNGFKEVKWYRCHDCDEIIRETHVDSHECEVRSVDYAS